MRDSLGFAYSGLPTEAWAKLYAEIRDSESAWARVLGKVAKAQTSGSSDPVHSTSQVDTLVSSILSSLDTAQLALLVAEHGFPACQMPIASDCKDGTAQPVRVAFWMKLSGACDVLDAIGGVAGYRALVSLGEAAAKSEDSPGGTARSVSRTGAGDDDIPQAPDELLLSSREVHQIEVDVPRTFREHPSFCPRGDDAAKGEQATGSGSGSWPDYRPALRRVLLGLAALNRPVGYVQSFNFMAAAMLLLTGGDEPRAMVLVHAMTTRVWPGLHAPGLAALRVAELATSAMGRQAIPAAKAVLDAVQLPLAMVLPRWLLCGFLSAMPAPVALRVWDASILAASTWGLSGAGISSGAPVREGDLCGGAGIRVLLQVAVGVLCHREAAILRAVRDAIGSRGPVLPLASVAPASESESRCTLQDPTAVTGWAQRGIPVDLQGPAFAAAVGVIQQAGEQLCSGRYLLRLSIGPRCLLPAPYAQRAWAEGCGLVAATQGSSKRAGRGRNKAPQPGLSLRYGLSLASSPHGVQMSAGSSQFGAVEIQADPAGHTSADAAVKSMAGATGGARQDGTTGLLSPARTLTTGERPTGMSPIISALRREAVAGKGARTGSPLEAPDPSKRGSHCAGRTQGSSSPITPADMRAMSRDSPQLFPPLQFPNASAKASGRQLSALSPAGQPSRLSSAARRGSSARVTEGNSTRASTKKALYTPSELVSPPATTSVVARTRKLQGVGAVVSPSGIRTRIQSASAAGFASPRKYAGLHPLGPGLSERSQIMPICHAWFEDVLSRSLSKDDAAVGQSHQVCAIDMGACNRLRHAAGRFFFGSRCPKRIATINEELQDLEAGQESKRDEAERPSSSEPVSASALMAAHVGRQQAPATSPIPIAPALLYSRTAVKLQTSQLRGKVSRLSSVAGASPRPDRAIRTPVQRTGSSSKQSLASNLLSAFASMFSPSGGREGRTRAMLVAAGEGTLDSLREGRSSGAGGASSSPQSWKRTLRFDPAQGGPSSKSKSTAAGSCAAGSVRIPMRELKQGGVQRGTQQSGGRQ